MIVCTFVLLVSGRFFAGKSRKTNWIGKRNEKMQNILNQFLI